MERVVAGSLVCLSLLGGCDAAPRSQAPLQNGTIVPWETAIRILNEGQVTYVTQAHDLSVVFQLRDGSSFVTFEPGIDLIFAEVDRCARCGDLAVATE